MRAKSTYVPAVLGAVIVVLWGGLVAPASAAPADGTCDGLSATIVGTDGNDDLTGTAGDDVVSLGPGDDTFVSMAGNDTVCGGTGDDSIDAEGGVARLEGEDGADTLTATTGSVTGGADSDTFRGPVEGGHDLTVHLGSGADRASIDDLFLSQMYGDEGRDVFEVPDPALGPDTDRTISYLDGGLGRDRLTFARSHHRVRILAKDATALWDRGTLTFSFVEEFEGSQRGDTLVGSDLVNDVLLGAGGDDLLKGGAGTDRLIGGKGSDTAFGGRGHDTCSVEHRHSC